MALLVPVRSSDHRRGRGGNPAVSPLALSAMLALGAPTLAQVPRGHAAVSCFHNGSPGGVALVHPSVPGAAVPVTGLSPDLTGVTTFTGAGSVLIDDRTGDLVVGEHTPAGQSIDIRLVTLAGTAVVTEVAYSVGIAGPAGGSIDQMAWHGNDILFCNRGGPNATASGPMVGHHLGLLRPHVGPPGTPGTVVPLPITNPPPGGTNAVALDPAGANAYLGKFVHQGGGVYLSNLYRIPLNGPGPYTATLVATIPDAVLQLGFDVQGKLLAGVGFLSTGQTVVYTVGAGTTPATVTPMATPGVFEANGLAIERSTGDLLLADSGAQTVYLARSGFSLPLATTQGAPTGIAIRSALATFGAASPAANSYTWQLAPNPGGRPAVGNAAFSLTIDSSPAAVPGLLALSLGALPAPAGLLWLDPSTLLVHAVFPAQLRTTVALPIPNQPALRGMDLFAQTGHVEAAGFASSAGLHFTLF